MKRLVMGILAHVDSGKTTLSEALLYNSGAIRKRGRVDFKDAHLDNNKIERERGITIFSKQAQLCTGETHITLLDTPGHVDFSAEAERTLSVLDYAVLVVSGSEGVQSHTVALFNVLKSYNVPLFIFVNKMDMAEKSQKQLMEELCENFGASCVNYSAEPSIVLEEAALCDDELTEEFLETGGISKEKEQQAIFERKIFPCFFGSALSGEGVDELLAATDSLTLNKKADFAFGGRVFKIAEDQKGQRMTFLKITGGELRVKELINGEKINEIRIYSGEKYESVQSCEKGEVCALCGLLKTYPGQGVGFEYDSRPLSFEPVFLYKVVLPKGADISEALKNFKKLEEEETKLCVVFNETLKEINLRLMGEVQSQVLKRIVFDRFGLEVEFEKGGIVYKETVASSAYGVGHYEPLRHYAEVHLKIEPGLRGSGIEYESECREDELDKNWQRLILTHLKEKEHKGVLCGFPLTDVKIILANGKAHIKHTEGGDFRQATYRALRQGLMGAKNVLLEPWYNFRLTVPQENLGRAMTDIQNMGGEFSAPEIKENSAMLCGSAPAAKISDYQSEITAYTHGAGRIECENGGSRECDEKEQDAVVSAVGYDAEADTENPADSVFCQKGAGFNVKWDKVFDYMHLEKREKKEVLPSDTAFKKPVLKEVGYGDEAELIKIFERTYGKIKPKEVPKEASIKRESYIKSKPQGEKNKVFEKNYAKNKAQKPLGDEYLLVDGYNILYAWYDLEKATAEDLDFARSYLLTRLSNYAALKNVKVIAVFDAYKVKGGRGSVEKVGNISVVYTKEAETADSYIEKTAADISKNHRVRVATSDRAEQLIIFSGGAFRVSASEFLKEMEESEKLIGEIIKEKEISSADMGRILGEKLENAQIFEKE